jgi:high-affinity iron transporter
MVFLCVGSLKANATNIAGQFDTGFRHHLDGVGAVGLEDPHCPCGADAVAVSEVVLFLYGVAAAQGGADLSMAAGGAVGLVLGAIVCLLTYLGLITIPTRYLFAVTSTLITLLAAGMAAQAIAFLQQANILTVFDETVWNTSWILSDSSLLGRPLHTLIGYVDQPTAMQLIAYAATLAVILVLMRLFAVSPAQRPRAA